MTELKFEDALKKLEDIVEKLESGNLALDDSMAKYEEGIRLAGICAKKLEAAKKKVEILVKTADGKFRLEPFDESGLDDVAIKKGKTKRPKNDAQGLFPTP